MRATLIGFLLFVLLSIGMLFGLNACTSGEPRSDAPLQMRWDRAQPVGMYLSENLTPCQRAGFRAAEAFWESLLLEEAIAFSADVPDTHESMSYGTRKAYSIAVRQGQTNRPEILDQAELFPMKHRAGILHSVEITATGCAPRAYAHELGHALGLGHASGEVALMAALHRPDAWDVSVGELRLLRQ